MSTNHDEAPPSYEEAIGNSTQSIEEDMVTNDLPNTSGNASNSNEATGSGSAPEASSLEKSNLGKAEEAGWKSNILQGVNTQTPGPESLADSTVMVLPPGLQPLLILDVLLLRGIYERGKGRRYRITNKNGEVVLYARSIRRGHHHPKDFQLYDSTRTAIVGKLAFSQAADNSMYCNLECPPRISLATVRAQDYTNVPQQDVSGATRESISSQLPLPIGHSNGVKYTVFNVLGQPVFIVHSPSVMNDQNMQIKVYSAALPGTSVADIWWDLDDTLDGAEEAQSLFAEKDESVSERRIKVTFPLDLEVKMKAALLALCLLKDKIDHRMECGSGRVSEAYRSTVNDVMGTAFGHGRRRHHRN